MNRPCFAVCHSHPIWEKNGHRYENPVVNLNHVQLIKRGHDDGDFLISAYLIAFCFANDEKVAWRFNDENVRDVEYYKIVERYG